MAGLDGIALGLIAAGGLLAFAGIKGVSIPSELQLAIQGKSPASAAKANPISGTGGSSSSGGTAQQQAAAAAAAGAPGSDLGGGNAANKALGGLMATAYGWGPGTEAWKYLETGWQEESGWSTTAAYDQADPYNNAYGIPQANPGTKMATAGANWKTSAVTQIKWGLQYIKNTYGSPLNVPGWSANGPTAGYVGY